MKSPAVIWITGASSGIGEALAYAWAARGAKLILSARRREVLERVKARCQRKEEDILLLPLDLAESETMEAKAKEALGYFGKVDILVHNGGISQRSLVKETDLSVDRRIMEVNFFGTVALTKALLPSMLANKTGRFVVVTSLVGKFGTPYRSAYAASKHALHGFFDSLRAELWQEGIRVTLICPGFIKTEVSINALQGDGSALNQMDDAQAKGMSAEACAKAILRAVDRDAEERYIGGREVMGIYLKRFFPRLFSRILRKARVR
jgi:short-subunit dehydrogenase